MAAEAKHVIVSKKTIGIVAIRSISPIRGKVGRTFSRWTMPYACLKKTFVMFGGKHFIFKCANPSVIMFGIAAFF